jgi:hypothetical protein
MATQAEMMQGTFPRPTAGTFHRRQGLWTKSNRKMNGRPAFSPRLTEAADGNVAAEAVPRPRNEPPPRSSDFDFE